MQKIIQLFSFNLLLLTFAHAESVTPSGDASFAATPVTINCQYTIPKDTKVVDTNVVQAFGEYAVIQSFTLTASTLDSQLKALKPCFTDTGWQGFNDALKKSGNLDTIINKKLNVSAKKTGTAQLAPQKDNQWKLSLPLEVTYQNNDEKTTQLLDVNVLITKKSTNSLGVMQVVAVGNKQAPAPAKN